MTSIVDDQRNSSLLLTILNTLYICSLITTVLARQHPLGPASSHVSSADLSGHHVSTSKTPAPSVVKQRYQYTSPNSSYLVYPIFETLDIDEVQRNLRTFTSFPTRHYLSEAGKQNQRWLLEKISHPARPQYKSALLSLSSIIHSSKALSSLVLTPRLMCAGATHRSPSSVPTWTASTEMLTVVLRLVPTTMAQER